MLSHVLFAPFLRRPPEGNFDPTYENKVGLWIYRFMEKIKTEWPSSIDYAEEGFQATKPAAVERAQRALILRRFSTTGYERPQPATSRLCLGRVVTVSPPAFRVQESTRCPVTAAHIWIARNIRGSTAKTHLSNGEFHGFNPKLRTSTDRNAIYLSLNSER